MWLCLLLLLPACVPTTASSPGIKGRVTRSALEYGRRFGLELLRSLLQKEHSVNLQGSYRAPLLGRLNYTVPQIHIHELQMNDSTVDFAEDVGVQLTVHRAQIQLNATWRAQLGVWQDSGSVQLHIGDLAVAVLLGLGADEHGHPSMWAAGCDAHGTDLHLEFHQGQSWLYNLLVPLLQRTLRQQLNKQLCVEIQKGISRLQGSLKNVRGGELGQWGWGSVPAQPSLLQLQQHFPNRPVELHLWARRQPLLSCHPKALHGALFGSAEAFVVLPNATRVPAFLLNIDANVTGKPTIAGNRLGGTVGLKSLSVVQVRSHVGPLQVSGGDGTTMGYWGGEVTTPCTGPESKVPSGFTGILQVEKLENMLKFGLWLFGVPWANKQLRPGVPLPTPHGITLLHPRLSLHEGFMLIATDLHYEP
ncbi:hypothetical protein ASZ78_005493 [Callipepla squamata]|uniref:Bactericidal permeability-increasing protein n=1 Tax=Callipepla squamata TaxID=9009 RepID=A0A226NJU6_CALSU|nr:hypothetical protein ASZ78_005493 [Callipepla squamata]